MKNYLQRTILVVFFFILMVEEAKAIPAFARKYRTSCTTCHTAFPKLNPFGRAFRNLGFQIPGGDEQYIKDKQVDLGAEAWKYTFPDGVWPGKIPGMPPIAVRVTGSYVLNTQNLVEKDFKFPSSLNVLSAGTLGENINFYVGIHLFDDGNIGFLNRAYIQFNNVLDRWLPEYFLNIRVGQFLPDFLPFAIHRGVMYTPYITNAVGFGGQLGGHHGGGGILEQAQRGVEIKGILNHYNQYIMGVVNGNGIPPGGDAGNFDDNNFKDVYFRVAHKFGGIGLDGYDPEAAEGVLKDAKNWRDNSIRLGVFGYIGNAKPKLVIASGNGDEHDGDPGMEMEQTEDFNRFGLDVDVYFSDLNLFGTFMIANETLDDGDEVKYNAWFIEVNYVYYPWLLPGLRYEMINPVVGSGTTRIVPNITALFRANIKVFAEMRINPKEFDKDHLDLMFGLDFVF